MSRSDDAQDVLLVLNAGSSSLKLALYPIDGDAPPVLKAEIDSIGHSPTVTVTPANGERTNIALSDAADWPHDRLIGWLVDKIRQDPTTFNVVAAGHRVVHGGRDLAEPVVVTPTVVAELENLAPLAPGHQPHNIAGIRAVGSIWPAIPQVACFDTAFHRSQPILSQLFALPRSLLDDGVLRYGFHGLSYEYIASELPALAPEQADGRVIVAHLGHGTSMCGLYGRRSMATSMGFTALDGLVMGKRCGELDPGVVLHLLRDRGLSVDQVDQLLNKESGLLGVSGISDDMRDLLASPEPNAAQAVDLFVYRAVRRIGSLAAVLGGLDMLVFTGGIGEHAAAIRARIVEGTAWLGARLDSAANDRNTGQISTGDSAIRILVVPTDEERIIARHTQALTAVHQTPK